VTVSATFNDARFNQNNGTEAVQAIASAAAYVDRQPWRANTVAHAMTASDGAFNSSKESASVRLSTTGLARGRHVVFVRARDASGPVGPPEAVYFTVQ
jgi:hypothetical protein